MPPRRQVPVVGAPVTVAFLARRVRGTIESVDDGGRSVVVLIESGELMRFALNAATGYFTTEGRQEGERLLFEA